MPFSLSIQEIRESVCMCEKYALFWVSLTKSWADRAAYVRKGHWCCWHLQTLCGEHARYQMLGNTTKSQFQRPNYHFESLDMTMEYCASAATLSLIQCSYLQSPMSCFVNLTISSFLSLPAGLPIHIYIFFIAFIRDMSVECAQSCK